MAINRLSPEIRGKFLATRGMTKQASHRGRQQQMLPIFSIRCVLFPKSLYPMPACSDLGQVQCSKGSIPVSVPAPVLRAAAGGIPGRSSWSLFLHKRVSHRLQGWDTNLRASVSQPWRKVAPFSHSAAQNTKSSSVSPAAPGIA